MRIPAHLRRSRHGIYYFRITVPLAIRETFGGRSEIKSSLHTRNLGIARSRRAVLPSMPINLKTSIEVFRFKRIHGDRPRRHHLPEACLQGAGPDYAALSAGRVQSGHRGRARFGIG